MGKGLGTRLVLYLHGGLVDLPNDMKENSNGCLQLIHSLPVLLMRGLVLEQQ